MSRIRSIHIKHFRCIAELVWAPADGINCLIGPGDSGKSSVLDAIDLCLSPKRAVQFSDTDFHRLDVSTPISITITVGDLEDALKDFERYGNFLRGFRLDDQTIEDEACAGLETVLSVNLTVNGDLDPIWTLFSERAVALGISRSISWGDRARLAPTRIGAMADHDLAWRRGSVLNRLTEEKPDTTAALAAAARDARNAFGDRAEAQLGKTLDVVLETARELGIDVGGQLKALLDAHTVSFGGGAISLHSANGVPLRGLGIGSTRLLTAGLQRKAAEQTSTVLIDELEHGLEPHRIIRLLDSIGVREALPRLQAFITTHSPVAIREVSGDQLVVLRKDGGKHQAIRVGTEDAIQGTIRSFPEAFLAQSVIVCEGASEVGLIRGLDQYSVRQGNVSIFACGIALVDAGGCDHIYKRVNAFHSLRYRTAVLRDDDKQPDAGAEAGYVSGGGALFKWDAGRALEDELFLTLSNEGVGKLVAQAISIHGVELIEAQITSETAGTKRLADLLADLSPDNRAVLGRRAKKSGWFKTVSAMEEVTRDIVGPDQESATSPFEKTVSSIFAWAEHA